MVSTANLHPYNSFFELSSNRRDIWHGTDMAGGGAMRVSWKEAKVDAMGATAFAFCHLAGVEVRVGRPRQEHAGEVAQRGLRLRRDGR